VNKQVTAIDDPALGRTRQVGPLATMLGTPTVIGAPAPALGQHQAEVLGSLAAGARGGSAGAAGAGGPAKPFSRHALEGVTLVEMGQFFAGPFAPALLADLGAR